MPQYVLIVTQNTARYKKKLFLDQNVNKTICYQFFSLSTDCSAKRRLNSYPPYGLIFLLFFQ